jgi:hypothetical protein
MMGCVLAVLEKDENQYRPYRTESKGDLIEKIRKESMLRGEEIACALQFLKKGWGMMGWLARDVDKPKIYHQPKRQ